MSSANRNNFLLLSSLDAFISFSCPIILARISSTMLNKSGKNRHPCLAADLRGKAFSLWDYICVIQNYICQEDYTICRGKNKLYLLPLNHH